MAKYYGVILLSKTISTEKLNSLEYAIKEKVLKKSLFLR